jgi:hypothetical protein
MNEYTMFATAKAAVIIAAIIVIFIPSSEGYRVSLNLSDSWLISS